MSRKPVSNNNQDAIKALAKREGNNICADCKRNKSPRWASWNRGVFICIRCSGIHRGMGVHISKVKSVDLDAWTDDQLKHIMSWGNVRANKWWEAKLAPGHVPSDGKIENFIRTKYESKRWVMDSRDPATMDPKTLDDEGDDDVPLNVVQQKAKLARESSQRAASTSSQPLPPAPSAGPPVDLFDGGPALPVRPSTTDTIGGRPPPPKAPAPPKQAKASESLLGMDFFGGPPSATAGRPSSSASTPSGSTVQSRPDLKQSILSLYATAPKTQPPPQQHERQSSFGGLQSPPVQQQSSFGGLDDAFSGLNFNPPTSPPAQAPKPQQQVKSDPFASFNNPSNQRSSAAPPVTSRPFSGGGFFDTSPKLASKPSITSKPPQIPTLKADPLSSNDFGDFSFASSPASAPSKPAMDTPSDNLFDFTEPSPPTQAPQPSPPAPQKPSVAAPPSNINSAFNLSTPAPPSQPLVKSASSVQPATMNQSGFSNMDAWGSSDAWATPEPTNTTSAPKPKPVAPVQAPSIPMSSDFSAWGGTSAPANTQSSNSSNGFGSSSHVTPKVAPDEDFGGWSSAAPVTPAVSNPPPAQSKPTGGGGGGFGGSDDLFSNVWE